MPRGMDERFATPGGDDGEEPTGNEAPLTESRSDSSKDDGSSPQGSPSASDAESTNAEQREADDEPLNIREDWDSATIYVEPEQSEDIEIAFTRLKKQLQREDTTLEKNKHFYRGIFEIAFDEHREETKARIRELAAADSDH
ncbi:hypothetical protein [Halobellus captivus]|uniref:hypothetical protein n=1 Tax=Halobellus captivus TaxID=2592614 RepID=UPI001EF14A67|nr:hypothetical protein [Halobellus captivus]